MNNLQAVWFLMAVSICPIIALILSGVALVKAKCKVGDVRYDDSQLQRRGSNGWYCLGSEFVKRRDFNKFREQLNCEHEFALQLVTGFFFNEAEKGEQYCLFSCRKCGLEKRVLRTDLTETEKKAIELVTDFKMKDRK